MNPADSQVLLVDDDPAMIRILSKWLEKAGYPTQTAGDGPQALAAIEQRCPDILITDWEMPHIDGLELCRRVRQLDLPHYVYIIFLTVRATSDEMIAGLDIGADDFLSKPVCQGELVARLRAGARVLELERRLSLMARTDPLTGLLTRRSFFENLEKEWQRAKRFGLPLSCVMVDIDFFKRINDLHGHPAGDAVLKSTAELIADSCRSIDSVCRYGGEEFCVLLPGTDGQNAAVWAERVRERLIAQQFAAGDKRFRITGSFGSAQRHDDTQTADQLIDQADQALLCAKQSGRDRVVRYESLCDGTELDLGKSDKQAGLFRGIVARHVMSPMVACLRENETVGQAAEFFLRSRINSTPVVDAQGRLVGILSEKDLMAAMVSLDLWNAPVRDGDEAQRHLLRRRHADPDDLRVPLPGVDPPGRDRQGRPPDGHHQPGNAAAVVQQPRPLQRSSRCSFGRGTRHAADPHRSKQRLAETARELAQRASQLERRCLEEVDDLVPYVVGGATGMQDLVNDLLAYSRYANQAEHSAAGPLSMFLESGSMD